jgi:hypothetical protein
MFVCFCQEGRFANWLENARDWNLSRNRFGLAFFHFVAVLRIREVYPGSEFFLSRIQGQRIRIPDSDPHQRITVILTQKKISKLSENMIRDVHPGSGSWFFTHTGSRIQGSKRPRIPEPQHCLVVLVTVSFCSRGTLVCCLGRFKYRIIYFGPFFLLLISTRFRGVR